MINWWNSKYPKEDYTEWAKNVGEETRKTWLEKFKNSFFEKYMNGNGLDVGYSGYLENIRAILPDTIGIDTNYPGYDGHTLPFDSNSQTYVYTSHTLEHIEDYKEAIREWYRVTKRGGHIIILVPHRDLYEKKLDLPSRWNEDHKRFYTPASLLKEIEDSLEINSYRVRHLQDNDEKHNYKDSPEVHGRWQYEIEVVIQKL